MKKFFSITLMMFISLSLAACGQHKSNNNTKDVSNTYSSSTKKTDGSNKTSDSKQFDRLWDSSKDEQLSSFMKSWGTEMKQDYVKRGPGNDTKNAHHFPKDFDQIRLKFDKQKKTVGWSDDGNGDKDINVVAIYEHSMPSGMIDGYHIYLFAFENGQPVVYHTGQDQPMPGNWFYFDKTANQDLNNGFDKIADGKQDANSNSTSSNKTISFSEGVSLLKSSKYAGEVSQPSLVSATNSKTVIKTFPGAKGQDIFTLIPSGSDVNINAVFGTLDGGKFSTLKYSTDMPKSQIVSRTVPQSSIAKKNQSDDHICNQSEALQSLIKQQGDKGWVFKYGNGGAEGWNFKSQSGDQAQVHADGTLQMDHDDGPVR